MYQITNRELLYRFGSLGFLEWVAVKSVIDNNLFIGFIGLFLFFVCLGAFLDRLEIRA